MAEMKKVSWRTVGYAALGSTALIAAAIGIVHSDGVRPTSLKSSAATRWLVYQQKHLLVLADGLSGKVLAKIDADSGPDATDEFAAQGAGGTFLIAPSLGTVRAVSTASLQLGTPQAVAPLTQKILHDDLGVGANGLTVVNPTAKDAAIVAAGDVTRKIDVPPADNALVARDGSMWLFTSTTATHVNVDGSKKVFPLRGSARLKTTVGSKGVTLDRQTGTLHWLGGGDVPITTIPNTADAVLQAKGDDNSCVWLAAGSTLACVGATGIERTMRVAGLNVGTDDKLAVTGSVAAVIHSDLRVQRINLDTEKLLTTGNPTGVPQSADLAITATNGMIWIDDLDGVDAWVINQFGSVPIHKNDTSADTFNAQGQVTSPGTGSQPDPAAGGNAPGNDAEEEHPDLHVGVDDPPTAVDDSVTARAGDTVTIPVTDNDWDPDGNAIAVVSVGNTVKAAHGTVDILNGGSVTYVPDFGYSGADSFDYTINDENGNAASATVSVQLFPADSPNRPPVATADHAKTRVGQAVTIDVLANDIDPERDMLKIASFAQNDGATITDIPGPTELQALKYEPPSAPGTYHFKYQAADPQGGTSGKTEVTVEVVSDDAPNEPPVARPDAIRLPIGKTAPLNVKANDSDPDGDSLTIKDAKSAAGVDVTIRSQVLDISVKPGAERLSVVTYTLTDSSSLDGHEVTGRVLVVAIDDAAPNGPPVANPDSDKVVVGNSVKIPVTDNDADPEKDPISLLTVTKPDNGVGTTATEGNSVRFTPTLPDITEPTQVKFTYKIGDGKGHTAIGNVTVTVLAEPLPRAPFARDDYADTVTDQPVIINALNNDTDPSGGNPSIIGNPVCVDGRATTTSDQRVLYTPPAGLTGTFRCKYRVGNGQGQADASIIVTVAAPPPGNHRPELTTAGLFPSVDAGKTLLLRVNDVAHDADAGDVLVFASASKPSNGTTDFTTKTSSFTYTAPAATGNDTPNSVNIDVTISDGQDVIAGTITIRINNPTVVPPPPQTKQIERTTTADVAQSFDVPAELRELNGGATLTLFSAGRDSSGADATVAVNTTTGIVTITPQQTGIVYVNFIVQGVDKQTGTNRIKLTVTDAPVTNLPPIAGDDDLVVSSGGSGSVDLGQNDFNYSDPGDKPVWALVNHVPASFGTTQLVGSRLFLTATPDSGEKRADLQYSLGDGNNAAATGTIHLTILACGESPPSVNAASEFTPYMTPINIDLSTYVTSGHIINSSISGAGLTAPTGIYTPPEHMNDSVTVTYTVANGCGQTAQGVLTIDVNRAPVANSVGRELSAGAPALTLQATDLASDSSQEQLTIQNLGSNPAWVTTDGSTLVIAPPGNTASGLYSFTATIADPGGLTATATVNITVTNVAPTAVADAFFTEATLLTFDPTTNDFDTEPGPLNVQVITPDSHVVSRTGNLITVSLDHGVNKFDYTIVDSGGLTSSSTVTITSNRAPTVGDVQAPSTNQPSTDVTLEPNDPDGDSLSVTCNAPPAYFDVKITNDSDPTEPNKVTLHIMLLQPAPVTAAFFCTFTDPFGASASAQVSVSFT